MQKKKDVMKKVFVCGFLSCVLFSSVTVCASSQILKKDSQGVGVVKLQKDLKTLGVFDTRATGYYGDVTVSAVKRLQKKYGVTPDGITGVKTLALIDKLLGRPTAKSKAAATKLKTKPKVMNMVSRGNQERDGYLIPWFGEVENIFGLGKKATVLDVDTGLTFHAQRSYGYNHADCETLTPEDTAIMRQIYGGQWSWDRRAIIVTVDGVKIAASMAGMPHAGDDSQPGNIFVNWRSEGYGYGANLDMVKNNDMDGHFDIHFLGSRTHGTNVVDSAHQNAVKKAAAWAENNF